MYSFPVFSVREKVPYYIVISFLLHLILLVWLGKFSPTSPAKETRVVFDVASIPLRPKAVLNPAKPVVPKPVQKKTAPPLKKRKPIPQEKAFPKAVPVDEKARFSMFKENLRGKKSTLGKNKKSVAAKQPLTAAKTPAPNKTEKTAPVNKKPAPAKTKPQKKFAINTDELFVRRKRPETVVKPKKQDFGQLLSNLDKHLEVEKYGNIGHAGEGMLSFTDSNFKAVWYGRIVKKKVIDSWFPPYAARALGLTGLTVITFRIQNKGQVTDIKIKDSSGNEYLDKSALNAIRNAGPFPHLPSDYNYDTLGVVFSFWYNLKPPPQG